MMRANECANSIFEQFFREFNRILSLEVGRWSLIVRDPFHKLKRFQTVFLKCWIQMAWNFWKMIMNKNFYRKWIVHKEYKLFSLYSYMAGVYANSFRKYWLKDWRSVLCFGIHPAKEFSVARSHIFKIFIKNGISEYSVDWSYGNSKPTDLEWKLMQHMEGWTCIFGSFTRTGTKLLTVKVISNATKKDILLVTMTHTAGNSS